MITVVGFLGSIVGVFYLILGKMILFLIYPLLKYFGVIAGVVGSWKWVNLNVNFNWLLLLGWYLILIWILIKIKKNFSLPFFYNLVSPRRGLKDYKKR